MTRMLVLGAGGRLGRMLAAHLQVHRPAGLEVSLLSRSAERSGWPWQSWSGNPETPGLFDGVDILLNLVGATPTAGHVPNPSEMAEANETFVNRLLDAAGDTARILIASSASVYGRPAPGQDLFSEDDTPRPMTDYARSKVCMEEAVAAREDARVCLLRIATVAGADQLLQNALRTTASAPLLLDRFASGRGPERSYVGPGQLSSLLLYLAQHSAPLAPVLNVAGPTPVMMQDLLEAMQAAGRPVHWKFRPAGPNAIERVVLDTALLEAAGAFRTHAAGQVSPAPASEIIADLFASETASD